MVVEAAQPADSWRQLCFWDVTASWLPVYKIKYVFTRRTFDSSLAMWALAASRSDSVFVVSAIILKNHMHHK